MLSMDRDNGHAYRRLELVMARIYSARQFGEEVGLEHLEVIRRIRKGDIKASKFGWNWVIKESEVERVKAEDWYNRAIERRSRAR